MFSGIGTGRGSWFMEVLLVAKPLKGHELFAATVKSVGTMVSYVAGE